MAQDPFQMNIDGVQDLVGSSMNKVDNPVFMTDDVSSEYEKKLSLKLSDEDLLKKKKLWESQYAKYFPEIQRRQNENGKYLLGNQRFNSQGNKDHHTVSSNLLFEATATFVPQALAENPEPVVWSDNTPEGKEVSKYLKTMLQFHAEEMLLRRKLGLMVWHWSKYFIAVLKYGWDEIGQDITVSVRNPKNFLFDPAGYVDEYGDFCGWLGERIECSASDLIDLYPEHKEYISEQVEGELGTKVVRTEWWTDDYSFITFKDKILKKHKNPFYNYEEEPKEQSDETDELADKLEAQEVKAHNHFDRPKMPYSFLSIFSMQEQPHDMTNLIEQNIANQIMINDRDDQINKNLRYSNNSMVVSGVSFNEETASQASNAAENGDPILVPDGRVNDAVVRLPMPSLSDAVFKAQDTAKDTLRSIYGTQGLTASAPNNDTTAHGMVINSNRDTSRIGGGVGDAIEQVAKNFFNKMTQMYYVFYDTEHYASVMGNGAAVSYVALQMTDQERRFIVSVSPNSMRPKDEISEQNLATQLFEAEALDPLTFFEKIDDPDPTETATRLMEYKTNPAGYIQQYLMPQAQQQSTGQAPPVGQTPPEGGSPPTTLSAPESSASLPSLQPNTQPKI
jgi:hypothetical protein